MTVVFALPLTGANAQQNQCRPGTRKEPSAILERAIDVMGVRAAGDRVLHMKAGMANQAAEQSEKWYPPFLTAQRIVDIWTDPSGGTERTTALEYIWPGNGPVGGPPTSVISSAKASYMTRDTLIRAAGTSARSTRVMDPWLTVTDWRNDATVQYAGECFYRDRWRTVLERSVPEGKERLFLDPSRAFPTKLEFDEPHYLWGQVHVENLYSDWIVPKGGKASYPGSVFRLEDGMTILSLTISGPTLAFVSRDSAPRLTLPPNAPDMRKAPNRAYAGASQLPDTVRVGPQTFLLVTPMYTETVTLQRDTVFLLDATTGEGRARDDSTWIAKLYPGKHPVVLVVTDLAWPHVAGVRFWVARGATIVSHAQSRGFLAKVTERKWADPDALDKSKVSRGAQLRFRAVTDSMSLAGGAVKLYEIDGAGSDGALMAYVPSANYLWAGDYVQSVRQPTQYGSEVLAAVQRVRVAPVMLAAMHLPLTDWEALAKLK